MKLITGRFVRVRLVRDVSEIPTEESALAKLEDDVVDVFDKFKSQHIHEDFDHFISLEDDHPKSEKEQVSDGEPQNATEEYSDAVERPAPHLLLLDFLPHDLEPRGNFLPGTFSWTKELLFIWKEKAVPLTDSIKTPMMILRY